MVNFGNTTIADLRLGSVQVQAAYLGNKQVWSLGPVVPKYDIKSIGRSTSQQGTFVYIIESGSQASTLYMRTNATDLTGKIVCASVYANAADTTPFTSFSFSNVALSGRYIVGTTPATSQWTPTGWTKMYVKTWIQDAGTIDESAALGEVLSWEAVEASSIGEPLCFTAQQANSTVQLNRSNYIHRPSLEYSYDKNTWSDYTWESQQLQGNILTLANVGDKVYLRAKNENTEFSRNPVQFYYFAMTGLIAASGNIQTLLRADGSRLDVPTSYCFTKLFQGCTSLTTAPSLPATTLAKDCYNGMFQGCTSLSAIPELNASSLVIGCYSWMFADCTSLTDIELTAASQIDLYSYSYMLSGCTDLSSVEVAFTNWDWNGIATLEWLNNVAATGQFICPAELPDVRDTSHIPVGWTKVDAT